MAKISWYDAPNTIDEAVSNAERARASGLHRYWNPQVWGTDPMVVLGIVAREVPDILLGTSVVTMQATLAQNLAAQARTISQVSGGRFTLGLGASHQPIMENQLGIPWTKPFTHMTEYLDALLPLMTDQQVSTTGGFVTHHCGLDVPGPNPDIMLAALGPRMLKLAAERTSGTITFMAGPKTIASHIRPHIGTDAQVAAIVPVWITDAPDEARRRGSEEFAFSGQMPSYRAMLDREGVDGVGDMFLAGDPDVVRAGFEDYRDAGATEIVMLARGEPDAVDAAWDFAAWLGAEI